MKRPWRGRTHDPPDPRRPGRIRASGERVRCGRRDCHPVRRVAPPLPRDPRTARVSSGSRGESLRSAPDASGAAHLRMPRPRLHPRLSASLLLRASCLGPYCWGIGVPPRSRSDTWAAAAGHFGCPPGDGPSQVETSPRPVIGGRSRAVRSPAGPSTTAGTALTSRMAVAFNPAVLWSPSLPMSCRSSV